MELDPKDYDVVKLLTKLKYKEEAYPSDLLTSRRQNYIRRVAEMGVGFGIAAGLRTTIKSGAKGGGATSTAGGLLETVLVVAIVAEAGTAAYFYRDKISEIIQSYSSQAQVQEVSSPPDFSSPLPVTDLPDTLGTPSPTVTPTVTFVPALAGDDNGNDDTQANATPDPKGNSGHHFGQTPRPDRTREPGNNDNNGNGNNR